LPAASISEAFSGPPARAVLRLDAAGVFGGGEGLAIREPSQRAGYARRKLAAAMVIIPPAAVSVHGARVTAVQSGLGIVMATRQP
jgi:hypothetical protein